MSELARGWVVEPVTVAWHDTRTTQTGALRLPEEAVYLSLVAVYQILDEQIPRDIEKCRAGAGGSVANVKLLVIQSLPSSVPADSTDDSSPLRLELEIGVSVAGDN